MRAVAGLASGSLALLAAAAAMAAAPSTIDGKISGYWRLSSHGPAVKPALTAWARTEMKKTVTKGDVDVEAVRWCVFQGMPFIMDNAGPIRILEGPHEVSVFAERISPPRHLYTAMKQHPSEDTFDNTVVGNSIAHWAGGDLLVDTTGFAPGVGAEGAPRTEGTHLAERYHLLDGGKNLVVTSTWTDPKVFAKPFVQTFTYERLPATYTPQEYYCDPRANGVGHPS